MPKIGATEAAPPTLIYPWLVFVGRGWAAARIRHSRIHSETTEATEEAKADELITADNFGHFGEPVYESTWPRGSRTATSRPARS